MSDFNETLIFSTDFPKIRKYQISWKSVHWEPSCSKRTDRYDEALIAFRNFATAPKNHWHNATPSVSKFAHCIVWVFSRKESKLEQSSFIGRYAVSMVEPLPTFRRIVVLPSSGLSLDVSTDIASLQPSILVISGNTASRHPISHVNSIKLAVRCSSDDAGNNPVAFSCHTTARRTGLYQLRYTAPKRRSWWWNQQSETCRALNDKLRLIIRICASSWSTYIHICNMMHRAYNVKLTSCTSFPSTVSSLCWSKQTGSHFRRLNNGFVEWAINSSLRI